jgi:hypothetical protein
MILLRILFQYNFKLDSLADKNTKFEQKAELHRKFTTLFNPISVSKVDKLYLLNTNWSGVWSRECFEHFSFLFWIDYSKDKFQNQTFPAYS